MPVFAGNVVALCHDNLIGKILMIKAFFCLRCLALLLFLGTAQAQVTPASGASAVMNRASTVATAIPSGKPDWLTQVGSWLRAPNVADQLVAVSEQSGYPVKLAEIEVFRISQALGSISAEQRAAYIQGKLLAIANSQDAVAQIQIIEGHDSRSLQLGVQTLVVFSQADADAAAISLDRLVQNSLQNIRIAILEQRNRQSIRTYIFGAIYSVLASICLWLLLKLNGRVFRWMSRHIVKIQPYIAGGWQVKNIQVISAYKLERLMHHVLRLARLSVTAMSLYVLLPLILSFFPQTRRLGQQLFDYFLTPFKTIFKAIIEFMPNLFFILAICVFAYYMLRVVAYVFTLIERGELKLEWFYDEWITPTYQIIRFMIIVLAAISALPYIPGAHSPAFQGIGLVLGLVVSLASSSAISNIIAGIILTYTRAFPLGDRIKVGDTVGDVVEKTLLVTRIRTIKNVRVTVPNQLVMSSQIINFSTSAKEDNGLILHTAITIGYDVPWQTVEKLLIEAAHKVEGVEQTPTPFVLKTALNDYYVNYEINAYTRHPEQMAVLYSQIHQQIIDAFDHAGVEIMSPHYYALRDGNASTVPSVLQSEHYTAPSFSIQPRT